MEKLPALYVEYPLVLLALVPVAVLVPALARARLRAATPGRRRATVGLRVAILALLVIALAGPVLGLPRAARSVVFAIDVSGSVSPQQQAWAWSWVRESIAALGPDSRTAMVEFGARAQVADPDGGVDPPPASATSIEQALRLARGVLPDLHDGRRDVVLLTDGWENSGRAAEWAGGEGEGMVISYVPLDLAAPQPPEVALTSVQVPPAVRGGDAVDIRVVLQSSITTSSTVRVWVDGQPAGERAVDLRPGMNEVRLAPSVGGTGFHSLRVEVEPEQDTLRDNNSAELVTVAHDPGRVLVLENRPGEGADLAAILAADGMQVETWSIERIPPSVDTLVGFDSAVLVDTPATSLTLDQQKTLQIFVNELGRGLVVVGGPLSYGPGGYEGTSLEAMLPVSAKPPEDPQRGSVALFLVVDKSASMDTGGVGEPRKLAMAREAAAEAVALLHPEDEVGVIAFDTEYEWVVPTARVRGDGDIQGVQARIQRIESGGGTSILPALQAAYQAASRSQARVKHIVLLTDGKSNDRGYEDLIRRMRAGQITLSTLAIGSDSDTELLAELAQRGAGRHYFTERSSQIPRIATKETSILTRNAVVEGQVAALTRDQSPLLSGLPGDFPPLNGYVATTPRDRAVTALQTERGDPLLAHWQYGLGRVVAWTSDSAPGGWAGGWSSDWPGARRFWSQAVRWSMPAPSRPDFRVAVDVVPGEQRVVLRVESAREDGSFADLLDTRATVVLPDETAREFRLPQTGPGTYQLSLVVDQPGPYRVLFSQREGDRVAREESLGFTVPDVGPEWRTVGVNRALLAQLAEHSGGLELRDPADVLRTPGGAAGERRVPLWPFLAALAALLLPLDVAARRLHWPRHGE